MDFTVFLEPKSQNDNLTLEYIHHFKKKLYVDQHTRKVTLILIHSTLENYRYTLDNFWTFCTNEIYTWYDLYDNFNLLSTFQYLSVLHCSNNINISLYECSIFYSSIHKWMVLRCFLSVDHKQCCSENLWAHFCIHVFFLLLGINQEWNYYIM